MLVSPSEKTITQLKHTLSYCYHNFLTYQDRFRKSGVGQRELDCENPLDILSKLTPLETSEYEMLSDEAIRNIQNIVDIETSSGTTNKPKRRFISVEDELMEQELISKMFKICGIGRRDRVACLDIDPLNIMASFVQVIQKTFITTDAYCYSPSHEAERSFLNLRDLDPTVIISVPTIIERWLPEFLEAFKDSSTNQLSKIIYVGENMPDQTRTILEKTLGVEIFSYYGATETSSMGIECEHHTGVHLFTDHNFFELVTTNGTNQTEILVTSLRLKSMPLLRYRIRDIVQVNTKSCKCGLKYPVVKVSRASESTINILGVSMNYQSIYRSVYEREAQAMQIILTKKSRDNIKIILPVNLRGNRSYIIEKILAENPDLEFLVSSGHLDFDIVFDDDVTRIRKRQTLVDLRKSDAA